MKKIVVTQSMGLYPDQVERLGKLGRVVFYNDKPATAEEWLKRCKGADIICTRKFGLKDKIYELSDVFVSLPFVGVDFLNKEGLDQKKNQIYKYSWSNYKIASR